MLALLLLFVGQSVQPNKPCYGYGCTAVASAASLNQNTTGSNVTLDVHCKDNETPVMDTSGYSYHCETQKKATAVKPHGTGVKPKPLTSGGTGNITYDGAISYDGTITVSNSPIIITDSWVKPIPVPADGKCPKGYKLGVTYGHPEKNQCIDEKMTCVDAWGKTEPCDHPKAPPKCSDGDVPESACKDEPPTTSSKLTKEEQARRLELITNISKAEEALRDYNLDVVEHHGGYVIDCRKNLNCHFRDTSYTRLTDKYEWTYVYGEAWVVLTKQWDQGNYMTYGTNSVSDGSIHLDTSPASGRTCWCTTPNNTLQLCGDSSLNACMGIHN